MVPFSADLLYDHTMTLPGGSTLMLRGDVRYLSPYDSTSVNEAQLLAGAYPYMRTTGEVVGDLSAAWKSADGKYSATAYVRNVGDNHYKTDVRVNGTTAPLTVTATPYDPRTYGIVLSTHF